MSAELDMTALLAQTSASFRIAYGDVKIDGGQPLNFARYPYIPEIIDDEAAEITIMKGAQMGFTIACILRALEEAKRGDLRGIGYFFPTQDEVGDFARARFGPMMTANPEMWGRYVKDTDSASLKRIGDTFLYFRGVGQTGSQRGRKSLSKLKSIPLDRLYLDERDEMSDARVEAALHRLDGSLDPRVVVLSTPTLPGYGVDLRYSQSNQCVWMWRCDACGEHTCLELDYPSCIVEPKNGEPYYRCSNVRCHKLLKREHGQWVARVTEIQKHHGYWVNQLSSSTSSAEKIVAAVLKAIKTGERRELENQTFARAYAEIDEEITAQMLNELVDQSLTRPLADEGPCAMGVDPGKPNWYEVRKRVTDVDSIQIARGRAENYDELDTICRKFNVQSGVMDVAYDPSAAKDFVAKHDGWLGITYTGTRHADPHFNFSDREVKVGRTWLLDHAHRVILHKHVKFHAKDEFWTDSFVPQMCNLKRATTVNDLTGEREALWVVTGGQKNDHLRHANAYCTLALERVGLSKDAERALRRTDYQGRAERNRGSWMTG